MIAPRNRRFWTTAILLLGTIGSLAFVAARSDVRAELTGPRPSDRQVTLIVSHLLRQEHLLKRPLDDEVSERAMKAFLKRLDPMKLYFQQEDIDLFMRQRSRIDDFIRRGDLRFAFDVFKTFRRRIDERVGFVEELLAMEHDFTVDEEIVTDGDVAKYSTSRDEAFDRWRKRIKYDLLILKTEEVTGDEAIDRLDRRYHSYAKRMEQFSSDDLLEMYLTAVTNAFDPHTTYMSPSSLENFQITMKLNLEGIGAALLMTDGYTVVNKIIPGGAADKHGKLKAEDRIVSVGQGSEGEMVDVVDVNLNDVVKLIRGKAGTIVRLGVKPAGGNEVEIYRIERAKIELKDSEARGEIIQETSGDRNYNVGVIDLPSFYMDMEAARRGLPNFKSTTRDVRRIIDDFSKKSVDVLVLDLRRNGGGSLTEAINLTGLFIDRGPVVQVKGSDDLVQEYKDLDSGMAWDGPLVVLTSKFSASASEILAGAIQDYGRGIVVGDRATHGKGTVQSLLDLGRQMFEVNPPNLGALKITMQQFYRPSGESTQKRGVLADVVLPSLTTHMDVGESDLDYPVEFHQIDPAVFKRRAISRALVSELNSRSAKRRETSDDFAKLDRQIKRYREQKSREYVTLNEERFFADRAELDADKAEEEEFEEQSGDTERPVFERNYYNNEVLKVAVDYVEMSRAPEFAGR